MDDLKSELTGKFETLMVSLMRPARIFDAHALKHAIKVRGKGLNMFYKIFVGVFLCIGINIQLVKEKLIKFFLNSRKNYKYYAAVKKKKSTVL